MFSLIIPVYNDIEIFEDAMSTILQYLKNYSNERCKIIILDRGSPEIVKAVYNKFVKKHKNISVIKFEKRVGLGYALKKCKEKIQGDLVFLLEPKLAKNIEGLTLLKEELRQGVVAPDIITGSRFLQDSQYNSTTLRKVFSKFYVLFVNSIFRTGLSDFHCNFKGFKNVVFEHLCDVSDSNMLFWSTESLVRAKDMGYNIQEVPVDYKGNWKVTPKNAYVRFKNVINLKRKF